MADVMGPEAGDGVDVQVQTITWGQLTPQERLQSLIKMTTLDLKYVQSGKPCAGGPEAPTAAECADLASAAAAYADALATLVGLAGGAYVDALRPYGHGGRRAGPPDLG